ncbi:uncharacterized protein LOC119724781 [Patiria miniata]|uniref:Reverse transcriptase domain-containing protein n=1 Tax=Patiria miniata TaxID=46514 RepID=A0A913ZJH1_PATMI|nr:uncharacterized protein LOC119724781 [Patiria miniata]
MELAHVRLRKPQTNMSQAELSAIRKLKNNPSVVIKPYDKGRGICIMNREDYLNVGFKHLSAHHYEKVDRDLTHETALKVHSALTDMIRNKHIDKHTFAYLDPLEQPTNCPTSPQPTYVRDTTDILRKLEKETFPQNSLLASIDVVSMYTNIHQAEAIESVCKAYEKNNHNYAITKPPSKHIRTLLELVLGRNYFQFGGKFFPQKIGCAMGSVASPEICDITLHDFELQISALTDRILFWARFRDDILIVYNGQLESFTQFVHQLNQLHPTLKFTFEASETSITYLDLTIFKGPRFLSTGTLDTRVFTKPTETYQYLERTSSHPNHVFKGFIKGEILRYARNTNNEDDFLQKVQSFEEKLLKRGYNQADIHKCKQSIDFSQRKSMIHTEQVKTQKELPLVFTTTYNPHVKHMDIKRALSRHWHLISGNPTLKEVFPKPPLVAYKIAENIKKRLVRAKLSHTEDNQSSTTENEDNTLDILISLLDEQIPSE